MRVRVNMDLSKPLKRRMKIRKAGDARHYFTFKYENVSTLCFICGMIRHSDKFFNQLFVTPEHEVTRP